MIGNVTGKDFRAGCGGNTPNVKEIFQRIRYALKQTPIEAAGEVFIGTPSLFESNLFRDRDECVKARLFRMDFADRFLRKLEGRDFPGAKFFSRAFDRKR